jgi:hypothetical protein
MGKPLGKGQLGRARRRLKHNIKMVARFRVYEDGS